MEKNLVNLLMETQKKKRKYFQNYKFYCKKIKKLAEKILGKNVRVLIFGSIVKGNYTPESDIDILIISENLPQDESKRIKIKTDIKSQIDTFSPFQIHLSTPFEFENWYRKFIKDTYFEVEN